MDDMEERIVEVLQARPGRDAAQLVEALIEDPAVGIYPAVYAALERLTAANRIWTLRGAYYAFGDGRNKGSGHG